MWTPSHGRVKAGRPARISIQQLCVDTGCSIEDLPGAMNDRDGWRERVREIRAGGVTSSYDSSSSYSFFRYSFRYFSFLAFFHCPFKHPLFLPCFHSPFPFILVFLSFYFLSFFLYSLMCCFDIFCFFFCFFLREFINPFSFS